MIMMINNSKNVNYYARREYVEKALKEAFKPAIDFDDLKYMRNTVTEAEYIKYANTIGVTFYLDVTAYKDHEILNDISSLVLNYDQPKSVITDLPTLREVANYFKEEEELRKKNVSSR